MPPLAPRPVHERHVLMRLPKNAASKDQNSVVLPEVDPGLDLDAIRRGACWYDASTRQIWVNGRLYGQHDTGQLFPIRGDGIVEVDRQTYKALMTLRRYNGVNEWALREITCDPHTSGDQRDEAIRIWMIREAAKREQQ